MTDIKKKGLGRGLSSLFGDAKNEEIKSTDNNNQRVVAISDLVRNKFQPRIHFDDVKIEQLSKSIKSNGIIQPIAVRPDKEDPGRYEIIAGERRWIAAQKAGLHEIPIVVHDLNDNETLKVAIVENIQRENLNSIEEARGYERLNKEFRYDQDTIANMMSKSRSHISNTLRLLTLPKDVIVMLEEGQITAGQARPLIGITNASSIAEEIFRKRLSSRAVETLVKAKKNFASSSNTIDINIQNIQNQIENNLGLKVVIKNKKNNKGSVIIEYKNLEQFELIAKLLSN
jgi:ParB family chromosome partitioning protein